MSQPSGWKLVPAMLLNRMDNVHLADPQGELLAERAKQCVCPLITNSRGEKAELLMEGPGQGSTVQLHRRHMTVPAVPKPCRF